MNNEKQQGGHQPTNMLVRSRSVRTFQGR